MVVDLITLAWGWCYIRNWGVCVCVCVCVCVDVGVGVCFFVTRVSQIQNRVTNCTSSSKLSLFRYSSLPSSPRSLLVSVCHTSRHYLPVLAIFGIKFVLYCIFSETHPHHCSPANFWRSSPSPLPHPVKSAVLPYLSCSHYVPYKSGEHTVCPLEHIILGTQFFGNTVTGNIRSGNIGPWDQDPLSLQTPRIEVSGNMGLWKHLDPWNTSL